MNANTTNHTAPILALDLGKHKSLAYIYPVFPRWLGHFGMAFAPFPLKTQRFQQLLAETTEEPNG